MIDLSLHIYPLHIQVHYWACFTEPDFVDLGQQRRPELT